VGKEMKTVEELTAIIAEYYPEFKGIHPAANLFPLPSEDDYAVLLSSITNEGISEPLTRAQDGSLLDGRSRLMACFESNSEFRVKDCPASLDPWVLSVTNNLARRNLTQYQKAFIADELRKHYDEEAKARQVRKPVDNSVKIILPEQKTEPQARDKAGKQFGVSGAYVDMARDINAYKPELKEQVSSGKLTITKAAIEARKAKAVFKAEEQKEAKVKETALILNIDGRTSEINKPESKFNSTNGSIEWASWSWNPVTGCLHGCKFCYAREIANNPRMVSAGYVFKFEPSFHDYRLDAPKNTKPPKTDDDRDGRVFVCSMADLFGKWVPDDWITKVFDACMQSPEWEYLFLTKWPNRYKMLESLPKAWFGASIIQQSDVKRVEREMQSFTTNGVKWISLEPMLEPITFEDLSWCDLVVIGAQTATTQPDGYVPAFSPEFDWVVDVVNQCRDAGVPYYLKPNLSISPGMALPKMKPRNNML
jgi:protein gp37